jgi:hypothetical protein
MTQVSAYSAEQRKIISLAEYRQRIALYDPEHPPPNPRPAAAKRPQPPTWINAVATPQVLSGSLLAAA